MIDLLSYKNEVEPFIQSVFDYYNGRVNIFNNKAVLDINWTNQVNGDIGGLSILPNIVTIYPMPLYRIYDYNITEVKGRIIYTIIHELYHTDQFMLPNEYMSNSKYKDYIEYACELESYIYMACNIDEIYNTFNIKFNIDIIKKLIQRYDVVGIRYQRRHYNDHIFMCILNLIPLNYRKTENINKIKDTIYNSINNKNNLILKVNDKYIYIIKDSQYISLESFNYFISQLYYDMLIGGDINITNINDEVFININTTFMNNMCRIINL